MVQSVNDIAGKAEPFLKRIELLAVELESEKGSYMERARALADDRKAVYEEAKTAGLATKALKALVKVRKYERKIDAERAAIDDIDEAAQFDALASAFAGTPFGDHAKRQAEAQRATPDDQRDFRPDTLRQKEREEANGAPQTGERADEANLGGLGRGAPTPAAH